MTIYKHLAILLYLSLPFVAPMASAQGTFQNLDFESANLGGFFPGDSHVPIANALPGWRGYVGTTSPPSPATNELTQVWYDGISLGGVLVSVIDTNAPFGFTPIAGRYSAVLFGGSTSYFASIGQTGLVPTGTESLRVEMLPGRGSFIVTLGGQALSMNPLETHPNYTLYGVDISAFAGLSAELRFTAAAPGGASPNALELDSIIFSTQSIPEPGICALSVLAGAVLVARLMRCRR